MLYLHGPLVRSKLAKTVGILYRVRHLLNRSALFILYCSLFLPYLTYCAVYIRTNLKAMSLSVIGAKLWNELDSDLRHIKNILLFKKN